MSYVCPACTPREPGDDTYASVLVLGAGQLGSTLEDVKRVSASTSVANISSYCMRCMRITPCLNAGVCMRENLMEWRRKYAFYTACEAFINEWPKKARVNRGRKSKLAGLAEDDAVSALIDPSVLPPRPLASAISLNNSLRVANRARKLPRREGSLQEAASPDAPTDDDA
jgi:hypothetical protein